jgi:hypothetical protein
MPTHPSPEPMAHLAHPQAAAGRERRPSSVSTDPTRLAAHLQHCAAERGWLHGLRGGLAAVHGLILPRFLSTMAILVLLLAASTVLWSIVAS